MKPYLLLILVLLSSISIKANSNEDELMLEYYIDSIIDLNDLDFEIAKLEFLTYAKKNYKGSDHIKGFVEYSANKIKSKEKEYTKNFTKELNELHAFAIMSKRLMLPLEKKIFELILARPTNTGSDLLIYLYPKLHSFNYWELNSYRPNDLGKKLLRLYSTSDNFDLLEKICLMIMSTKIYKASYYVNPMHICQTSYAKTKISLDLDSLNLKTKNITIDSIPSGIKPPAFIGGNQVLKAYIQDNIKYPEKALNQNVSGRVLVSFKVNEVGNIYNIRIKDSPSEFLSKEAIRMVQSFPQFKPDIHTKKGSGFTKFTIPFEFTLPEQ